MPHGSAISDRQVYLGPDDERLRKLIQQRADGKAAGPDHLARLGLERKFTLSLDPPVRRMRRPRPLTCSPRDPATQDIEDRIQDLPG